jgi:hypothetical protein
MRRTVVLGILIVEFAVLVTLVGDLVTRFGR